MTPSSNVVTVSVEEGCAVLALPARLESALEDALVLAVEGALEKSPRLLVLDFSAVTFTASAGIGLIVDTLRRASAHNVKVALAAVQGQPRMVLERIGLGRHAEFYETVAAARAAGNGR